MPVLWSISAASPAQGKQVGVGEIEEFALALGRHFLSDTEPVEGCRIEIDEYAWERVLVSAPDGSTREHDNTWVRKGQETRTTVLTIPPEGLGRGGASGLRVRRPGGAEVDGLGVQGLPGRRVHGR